jgi:hypothetical protein
MILKIWDVLKLKQECSYPEYRYTIKSFNWFDNYITCVSSFDWCDRFISINSIIEVNGER